METRDLLEFGPFRADLRRRALLRDSEPVALPAKAFDVLVVLLRNAGATVTKEEILKTVWPDAFVEEGNLTQTIFLLRKALEDSESQPYIVTVPRQGYRFVGTVAANPGQEAVSAVPVESSVALWKRYRWYALTAVALAGVGGAVATMAHRQQPRDSFTGQVRFEVAFPSQAAAPVLSPDGRRMAIVPAFQDASGTESVWIRDMNGDAPYPLVGTENARLAFWSPDSCCLGFMAHGKLKSVSVSGGPVRVITDAPNGRGGSWNQAGTILFAPTPGGPLHSVPAAGGVSVPVTALDPAMNENSHRFPVFLPDGKRFFFLAQSPVKENLWIRLGELGKATSTPLVRSDSNAVYVPQPADAGLLLYVRNQELLAQTFHAGRGEVTGDPRVIAKSIQYSQPLKFAHFSAIPGILAYRTEREQLANLRWFSRTGEASGDIAGGQGVWQVHLSRDGNMLAGARMDAETGTGDIWTFDLSRGGANRVTRHPAWESLPVLSPDNKEVVFASDRFPPNAYVRAVEGASPERPLFPAATPSAQRNPYDWSFDGRFILFSKIRDSEDIWVFDTAARREFPLAQGPFNESQGQFSTDGRWVAYTSDETGKPEVYAREFLAPDKLGEERIKVSVDGGVEPRWRQDGKELFYIAPGGALMAAPLQAGSPIRVGKPLALASFAGKLKFGFGWHSTFSYAVSGNGQKFLLVNRESPTAAAPITVVLNATP